MITITPDIALYVVFFVSFVISYLSVPVIVRVARNKNFFDKPTHRKSHNRQIPTLGGVAIFSGFTVAAGSFLKHEFVPMQYILAACIIIFFVGIKDDIQSIAPHKKLIGQIVAALVLIVPGNLYFSNLHGFLGVYEINIVSSLFLTLFVIILIINSVNLIDGIDGLATSIGILATVFFGVWFFISGNIEYSIISAAVFGSLLAFYRFNMSNREYKIFMGDTGSMLVGLLLAIQIVIFNELNAVSSAFSIKSAPAISIAVLIIPLYDTIRVFIIRMSRGRSPFVADKNHLHHCMLKLGFTHVQSTFLIIFANICFIALALLLQNLGIFWILLIIMCVATALSLTIEHFVKKSFKQKSLNGNGKNEH